MSISAKWPQVIAYEGGLQQIAGLKQICLEWQKFGFWSFEQVNQALATHGTQMLFTHAKKEGKEWSGACFYRNAGETADLLYVFVSPAHRRKGLADKLMSDMVKRLRASGCKELILEVRPQNTAAISLYEVFGMKKIAIREKYYQNGDDAYIFKLGLR